MLCKKTSFMGLLVFFTVSIFLQKVQGQNLYLDTLWVPVTFYDYWVDANGTNPDFETGSNGMITGMTYDTLDNQKKPVPTPLACSTPSTNAPAACHLSEWFRVSGAGGSDNSCVFVCDSETNPKMKRWHWTTSTGGPLASYQNRRGEYIGPDYDATYNMRNIIIYDSLPFLHLGRNGMPALLGVYEINNAAFFPLDNRGFGVQPSGQNHNFAFTMELHTTFVYRSGLKFTFASDDDVWVFINGKKVVDLGGRHGAFASSINLDTLTGMVSGQNYTLDFLKAERHTTGSDIRITTSVIAPLQTPVLSNEFPRQVKLLSDASSKTLHYSLSSRSYVSLKYFDIRGRMVASFVNQLQEPGSHYLSAPGTTLKRGAYIQLFSAGRYVQKDLILIVR